MTGISKIVRIMATDVDGELSIRRALMKIKGISFMFANAVCNSISLDPEIKIGSLSQEQIKLLEENIKNPKIPAWLMNRRNDPVAGKNKHLVGFEIDLVKREDINILRKIRAYRGIRHELGLPVRGQRTRSTFRKNKTVGVIKKKARGGK